MDAKDSNGRRISLLNADDTTLPNRQSFANTRHSSYSSQGSAQSYQQYTLSSSSVTRLSSFQSGYSSPCSSPQTPSLVRSRSSDSTADMQTPSPITPEFGYLDSLNAHPQAYSDSTAYFNKDLPQYIPQQPPTLSQTYMQSTPAQPAYYAQPPAENKSAPAQKSKKNQYPCPVAKQYNCSDHFTTSGHAARHAKKHTGKKDAMCPECNKAFTRKDNMEQHRRTHLNGRSTTKGTAVEDRSRKVVKQQNMKRPKPAPLQAAQPVQQVVVDPALPQLPISPTANFPMASQVHMDPYQQHYMPSHTYPDPSQCAINPMSMSTSFGLDTLAAAAAIDKRDSE
ncbi:hypothetical protein EJ05DRAFT_182500 [Pseudovirgaria hyperparasitica]|uniref:C2H2-type domain-containing protein n=1 Tax=Pseudovirgaria hyperparasitica TaxID=470096 RepID=A0A6A6WI30_9PEZI|nr:uncharacterized protein EJ05DRAFT_182500 [Pseudovirgaria hyperparasitica]KAF2761700.1 hypothetical protein EJ05DRAFT_182500 [Pseudovirgaria hyperparasitica]